MPEQLSIIKNKVRPVTQDYERLRQLGIEWAQKFSKEIWTDYNAHDPGVTAIEIFGYAITDLAHRMSLRMEDLLARTPGDVTKDFFTAREILPCNPVTFDDLRKKIIDVNGVENAWLLPYTDCECSDEINHPAFYIRCTNNPRAVDLRPTPAIGFEPRTVNGLYDINLLMEEDPVLGDLNIISVDWELRDAITGARKALVRFIFPINVQKTYPVPPGITDLDRIVGSTITDYTVLAADFDALNNTFDLTLKFGANTVVIEHVAYQIRPFNTTALMSQLEVELATMITSGVMAVRQQVIARVFTVFQNKLKKINGIIDEVYCMYQKIRNLCEDVYRIGIVPTQEIALCSDIETDAGADLEEILGKIYFLVDTFFSPPVRFYLLRELLAKKIPTDIIFEGPILKHGFILDEELRKSQLFTAVHVSDLYNLIMGIEGVKAVKYLQITNYLNGIPLTEGEFWKIDLKGSYHLNLDRLRSKITFYKGNMPIIADKEVVERIYQDLKATLSKPRPSETELNDILPPVGTSYQLDDYYSIQNDFPAVYGVGKDGIPSGVTYVGASPVDTRDYIVHKSKVKQFKGYLLFFDQLLANYFSQLRELKNVYAVANSKNDTYFFQPVYDKVADAENLNFYDTAPLLTDFAMPPNANIDDPLSYKTQWDLFIQNPANNYITQLKEITEPEDKYLDRRNRFLDHLLSRFAENFSDYAVMMYKFAGNQLESADKKTAEEIAEDKYDFLQNYHILSYNRGKGQYYKYCALDNKPTFNVTPAGLQFQFTIRLTTGQIITSVGTYVNEDAAFKALRQIVLFSREDDKDPATPPVFVSAKPFAGKFRIEIKDLNNNAYANSGNNFNTQVDADKGVRELKQLLEKDATTLEYDTYSIPLPHNATGLQKRAARLLGMSVKDNGWLVLDKFIVTQIAAGKYKFTIQYDDAQTLESIVNYPTEVAAFEAMEDLVPLVAREDTDPGDWIYFRIKAFGGGQRIEVTTDGTTTIAVSAPVYPTVNAAIAGYKKLRQALLDEGMHVIDHLLLRPLPIVHNAILVPEDPQDASYGFFPLCTSLNPDCNCPILDYYSFRISVVLPYWTQRFRNMDFRGFAEDTIHRETPAHILPKFCWVSMYDMFRLETAYKAWFLSNRMYKPNMNTLKDLLVDLIRVLNTLTNVYPEGHLHDCDNPGTDNPVILDQTILGTF